MKRLLVLLAAVALLGAACSDDDDAVSTAAGGESTTSSEGASFNDADVEFAQKMIAHHEQAIEMAQLAGDRADSADVVDLARRIEEAQGPEIETLRGWLGEWDEPTEAESMGGMDHGEADSSMMSEDDMTQLEAATGPAFDRMFLEMMTEHHQGAIDMAQQELEDGEFPEAKSMAQNIVDTQEAEIEEMQTLLQGMS